jgi:hypothetical protein
MNTSSTVRLIGGLVVAVLLAGCGGTTTASPGPSASNPPGTGAAGPVQVTLGIYSGRADPTWTLTDAEAASLGAALAKLAGVVGLPPVGGLGYHGFTIERPDGTVVAFNGAVAPPGDRARAYLADPARTIERLLLETARPHVAGNELVEVERALAAP